VASILADAQLTAKQRDSLLAADARYNIWDGSVRSGKSVVADVAWIDYVLRQAPPGDLLLVGRTQDTVVRNVVNEICGFVGEAHARYKQGELTLFGRRIYVIGANDETAVTKIQGMTLAGGYVDEASTIPESFWDMLTSRFSVKGARLFATTNPDTPAHWLKTKYLDRANDPGAHLKRFQFHIDDNTFLDPEFVKHLKHMHTGLWYKRYIEGEWVIAAGAIYTDWDPARHVVHEMPAISRLISMGVDYGTTNATAGLLIGISAESPARLVVVDEWAPPTMTDSGLSADYRKWIGSRHPEWVCVDPSAASFKMQLFADGVSSVTDGTNAVVGGIRTVASLLATDRLVVSDKCVNLIKEIPAYAWDPKATAKGQDAPIKLQDHFCDALRYSLATTRQLWGMEVPVTMKEAA